MGMGMSSSGCGCGGHIVGNGNVIKGDAASGNSKFIRSFSVKYIALVLFGSSP